MPQPHHESTPRTNPEQSPSDKGGWRFLTRFCSELASYKRLGKWVGITLLMVTAMRSAANHFLPEAPTDQHLDTSTLKPGVPISGSTGNAWWNPAPWSYDSDVKIPPLPASTAESSTKGTSTDQPVVSLNEFQLPPGISTLNHHGPAIGSVSFQNGSATLTPPLVSTAPMTSSASSQAQAKSYFKTGKSSNKGSQNPNTISAIATPAALVQSPAPGGSIVPVEHGYQLSSSKLLADNNAAPLSLSSSKEAYAVLGLGTSSTPAAVDASSDGELHFSLSAQVSAVPTYSISGGTFAEPLATPEPATSGMLVIGLGLLASRRRPMAKLLGS